MLDKRIIAIHLPQFYPFPENDEWWGKGFTEWRNVASAKPRFKGHYQPHIPADLGFYDLRLKESRIAQQELAKEYGIYGFCYYHYWFNGHLLMEKPVEAMLADKDETLPFMLCWANENWGRNWTKGKNEILIQQKFSVEDDINHFNYLLKFFKDPRYIRVNDKPVFGIHRTDRFPDPEKTIKLWKSLAKENGFELYVFRFEAQSTFGKKYLTPSMDAAVQFQPFAMKQFARKHSVFPRIINKLLKKEVFSYIYKYKDYVDYMCTKSLKEDYKLYPSLFPCWDNSSRRVNQAFLAFKNASPQIFQKWFDYIYNNFVPFSKEENFIFINAWNEWAEGCHLEPDMKFGTGFLEAIKNVLTSNSNV